MIYIHFVHFFRFMVIVRGRLRPWGPLRIGGDLLMQPANTVTIMIQVYDNKFH